MIARSKKKIMMERRVTRMRTMKKIMRKRIRNKWGRLEAARID
jgi:hypothetical protein